MRKLKVETLQGTLAGKQLALTLATGHEGDLMTHTPTINLLSSGVTTPEVTIANKAFSIILGDLGTPTTVGQLKEVLEEKAEIVSVQTTHDTSEELIPDQLSQEMKLYLSGKELLLEPKTLKTISWTRFIFWSKNINSCEKFRNLHVEG